MTAPEWVVLDLGNVIINNDPLMAYVYHMAFEKIREKDNIITFKDILERRLEIYRSNLTEGIFYKILQNYLSQDEIDDFTREYTKRAYSDLHFFYPFITGAKHFIEKLSKAYKLGILANQPSIIKNHLIKHRLYPYFDFIGISEEIGLRKPDMRAFEWIIDRAGTLPDKICYIGDTLHNDIIPANSAGLRTILLRQNVYCKGYKPEGDLEMLYLEYQDKIDNYAIEEAKKLDFYLAITLSYEQILYYLNL